MTIKFMHDDGEPLAVEYTQYEVIWPIVICLEGLLDLVSIILCQASMQHKCKAVDTAQVTTRLTITNDLGLPY